MDQVEVPFRPLWMIGDSGDDSEALRLQVLVSPCPRRCDDSDAGVVKFVGELDAYSAELVEPTVRRFVLFADDIVIDLSELDFIDAAGLRFLISLVDGGAVRLENPGRRISRVFEIAGLTHLCDGTVTGVARLTEPSGRLVSDPTLEGVQGRVAVGPGGIAGKC